MSYSAFAYTYNLEPKIRGRVFSIGVRADPSLNNVESFAVILFLRNRDGKRIEVAKIDTTPHDAGRIHIDRYYREEGAEIKAFDIDIDDWIDAEAYLKANWQRFARRYLDTHGTELRADGANT
ncbi:DUF7718 family protein [Halonotius terrestris]